MSRKQFHRLSLYGATIVPKLSDILFLLKFFYFSLSSPTPPPVHQTTTHPLIQNEGTTHPIPLPFPPNIHTSYENFEVTFFPSFQMILPILLSMCDCFFSSVSKSFLTESTQCQHFSAAWWLLRRIFYCVLIFNCSYVCSMLLYNFRVMQLT